jgi:rhodanese-related sulfurtransferase
VRQTSETDAGHVPGAAHVELGDLSAGSAQVPAGVSVVMCGHGERAITAASMLERTGRTGMAVLIGGPDEWADAHRTPLDSSA